MSGLTAPDLDAVLASMWAVFAPLARTRVELLEAYTAALVAGQDDPELRRPAATAAHQLAGALGSYGRPGSDEASALELLLRDQTDRDVAAIRAQVTALRAAVDA